MRALCFEISHGGLHQLYTIIAVFAHIIIVIIMFRNNMQVEVKNKNCTAPTGWPNISTSTYNTLHAHNCLSMLNAYILDCSTFKKIFTVIVIVNFIYITSVVNLQFA